jgi:PAS domain S-box-containing protein
MNFYKIYAFFKYYSLATGIMLFFLFLTLLLYREFRKRVIEENYKAFEHTANQANLALYSRLQDHFQLLQGAKGLFIVKDTVTQEEWEKFTEGLNIIENYPGMQGIGFSTFFPKEQLNEHIAQVREQGFEQYTVFPPGERDFYSSILYLVPLDKKNQRAIGYDMYSDPIRKKAMLRAIETNSVSKSGKVILIQEDDQTNIQSGFLLYLPIYRGGLDPGTPEKRKEMVKGFVYNPFRTGDFMEAIFGRFFQGLNIEIYDEEPIPQNLLYTNHTLQPLIDQTLNKIFLKTYTSSIGGRKWMMVVSTPAPQGILMDNLQPLIILITGTVLSIMLFFVLYSFSKMKKANELKQSITDNATAALFMMDINGYCTFMNPAAEQMTGFTFEEIQQKPLHDMIHHTKPDGSHYPVSECPIDRALPTNNTIRAHEDVFVRKDGTFYNVTCAARPVFENNTPVSTVIEVRDITEEKIAQQKIIESAEQILFLAESMPQKVWTTDPNGNWKYVNKNWTQYTGLTFDEIISEDWQKIIHPDDVKETVMLWKTCVNNGDDFLVEHRIRRHDGLFRWHLTRARVQKDNQGNISQWVGTNTDIHEQKLNREELQENNKTLKVLNQISLAISAELNPEKLVQIIIDSSTDLLGAEFGAFFHCNFENQRETYKLFAVSGAKRGLITNMENGVEAKTFDPILKKKGIIRSDNLLKEKELHLDKHTLIKSILTVPVMSREGNTLGALFFGHTQKSAFKKKSEEIVQSIASQAAIVMDNSRLFETIIAKNKELIKINNDLDNFVYTASHDLKAPIANLEGLLNHLIKLIHENINNKLPQINAILPMMEKSIYRFKATIQDLTDISKIQKNTAQDITNINIRSLLDEILDDISPLIKENKATIEINFEDNVEIQFSKTYCRSILYNLISNAIKYRSPKRPPVIRITGNKAKDYWELQIQDNGLGISEDKVDKVFGMFKRLHTHVEGSGVGLYIVKRMIENAGGKIKINSHEDVGTTFSVFFPINKKSKQDTLSLNF